MNRKHKNLGRVATTLSVVRWIVMVALVAATVYFTIVGITISKPYGCIMVFRQAGWIVRLVMALVGAFLIWLGTEVVIQVLRHFMRMEMIALFGPSGLNPPGRYPGPYGQQMAPPPVAPMPPEYAPQPEQGDLPGSSNR